MKKLGLFVFNIITSLAIIIFRGFVITKLWSWFVIPQFGLSPLSVSMATGLALLITLLTFSISIADIKAIQEYANETDEEKLKHSISSKFIGLFMPASFMLTGYIITLFL